jgi:hypothetical protein
MRRVERCRDFERRVEDEDGILNIYMARYKKSTVQKKHGTKKARYKKSTVQKKHGTNCPGTVQMSGY